MGIGSAMALALGKEGAAVAVDYRSHPDEAKHIVDRIEGSGGRAISVRADVSSPEDVKNLIQKAVEEFGRLDVMINNAGMEEKMPFLETPLDVWNKTIAVNLTGAWLGCQEAARQMVNQGGSGRIINQCWCSWYRAPSTEDTACRWPSVVWWAVTWQEWSPEG